jgi:flagellin-specific chaperone FliS
MSTLQLTQVNQLLKSFADSISGINEIGYAPVKNKLGSLADLTSSPASVLRVDVFIDELTADQKEKFCSFLGITSGELRSGQKCSTANFEFSFLSTRDPVPVKLGDLAADVFILAAPDIEACAGRGGDGFFAWLTKNKAVVLVWTEKPSPGAKPIVNEALANKIVLDGETASLTDLISGSHADSVRAYSALIQAEETLSVLSEVLSRENVNMLLKKTQQTQSNLVLRKIDEAKYSGSDALTTLKGQIQLLFNDVKKRVKTRYDDLNKSQVGEFNQFINQKQNEIKDFEEKPNIEKPEKLAVTLPTAYEVTLQNGIHNLLSKNFKEDLSLVDKTFRKAESEMNSAIPSGKKSAGSLADADVPPSPHETITNYAKFSKPFQGEITKRGFMEYFIAIRDYTTQISVVTGLLMPLVIIVNSLQIFEGDKSPKEAQVQVVDSLGGGLVANADLGVQPVADAESGGIEWKKTGTIVRYSINLLTGVITIFMIFLGFYVLRKTIPKKRVEEKNREMVKAKEYIASECKKIFNDATREWSSVLVNHLDDVYQHQLRQLELYARSNSGVAAENSNNEKLFQQRLQLNLDAEQKRISNLERQREDARRNIANLKREIQKSCSI